MIVTSLSYNPASSVPNYYLVYLNWYRRYTETGDVSLLSQAYHYARVAEEFDQAIIEEEVTDEILFER